jgi:hypothetical protein
MSLLITCLIFHYVFQIEYFSCPSQPFLPLKLKTQLSLLKLFQMKKRAAKRVAKKIKMILYRTIF